MGGMAGAKDSYEGLILRKTVLNLDQFFVLLFRVLILFMTNYLQDKHQDRSKYLESSHLLRILKQLAHPYRQTCWYNDTTTTKQAHI